MKLINKKGKKNLSYFYSTLQNHLYEHFPELINDEDFIITNVENAEDTYMTLIQQGYSVPEAMNEAQKDLLNGLEFSKFDLLYDIVTEEFTNEVPEEDYQDFCKHINGVCGEIFDKYNKQESEELRTELIGFISAFLEGFKHP